MNAQSEKIIEKALKMPQHERAYIAEKLISSLDKKTDPDVEKAWQEEIQKRVNQINSTEVECLPWEEVYQRLKANSNA